VKQTLRIVRLLPQASVPLTAAMAATVVIAALVPNAFRLATGAVVGTLPRAIAAGPGSGAAHRVFVLIAIA